MPDPHSMVFAISVKRAFAFVGASIASTAPKEGASLKVPTVSV
jgi:hypothetical protein